MNKLSPNFNQVMHSFLAFLLRTPRAASINFTKKNNVYAINVHTATQNGDIFHEALKFPKNVANLYDYHLPLIDVTYAYWWSLTSHNNTSQSSYRIVKNNRFQIKTYTISIYFKAM